MPLEKEHGRYQIDPEKTYYYQVEFYAPAGIPNAGRYYFDLPEGITTSAIERVTYEDGDAEGDPLARLWAGDGASRVYLDVERDNRKVHWRGWYQLEMSFEVDEWGDPVNVDFMFDPNAEVTTGCRVSVEAEFRADGSQWTHYEADLPTFTAAEQWAKWSFTQTGTSAVRYSSSYPYYNGNMKLRWDEGDVRLVIHDGSDTTFALPHIDAEGNGAAPDDQYAIYEVTVRGEDGVSECQTNVFLLSRAGHDDCQGSEALKLRNPMGGYTGETVPVPAGWCDDWTLPYDATLVADVENPYLNAETMFRFADEAADWGGDYRVQVLLRDATDVHAPNGCEDVSECHIDGSSGILDKAMAGYGSFRITFDNTETRLLLDEIDIVDTMDSGIMLETGSLVVERQVVDAEGADAGDPVTLVEGSDYRLAVDADKGGFTLTLLDVGPYRYEISYDVTGRPGVAITPPDVLSNTASCEIWGKRFEDTASTQRVAEFSATEAAVSLRKTDDATGAAVPGAEYTCYGVVGGATGTVTSSMVTDAHGEATFTNTQGNEFFLAPGVLYYVAETAAPEGYELNDTRYFFYLGEPDQTNPDTDMFDSAYADYEMAPVIAGARLSGLIREGDVVVGALSNYGYIDTVRNEWTGVIDGPASPIEVSDSRVSTVDISVKKVWADVDHEDQRPQSIMVELLCDGVVYDTVTLDEAGGWSHSWSNLEAGHEWSVREAAVPEGYASTVTSEEGDGIVSFTVTNTYDEPETPPDEPPTPPDEPPTPPDEPEKLDDGPTDELAQTGGFVFARTGPIFGCRHYRACGIECHPRQGQMRAEE